MLKLSRRAQGLLNNQYRSVLKKCFIINTILAAVVGLSSPAQAASNQTVNSGDSYSDTSANSVGALLENLKNGMGSVVDAYTAGTPIGKLYVNTNAVNEAYSDVNGASAKYGPWIINYGDVYIGKQYDKTTGAISEVPGGIILSNHHNMNADTIYWGGGIIANGGGNLRASATNLQVINTTFKNNTATSSELKTTMSAVGGAISSFSTNEASVKNSSFLQNYVMSAGTAAGGAVYNGVGVTSGGTASRGVFASQNNIYQGNYAGNQTSDLNLKVFDNSSSSYVSWIDTDVKAENAQGGAVFNNGDFSSVNDIFENNFAQGKTAQGGAVYNGTYNLSGSVHNGIMEISNSAGNTNFKQNYASGETAQGGALYNSGKLNTNSGKFLQNYVSGKTEASGGANYNSGDYTAFNEIYVENYADGKGSVYGGAVYNSGKITMTGTNSFISNKAGFVDNNGDLKADSGYGGAIYNSGTVINSAISKVVFNGNQVTAKTASGGAVFSNGSINLSNITFTDNHVSAQTAKGGAFANASQNTDNTLTDSSFSNNSVKASTTSATAFGGAIYNSSENTVSVAKLLIKATNSDVYFQENSAVSAQNNAIGGAIYNGENGQLNLESNGAEIVFVSNKADNGGAIANSASGAAIASTTSYFKISATNGDVYLQNNVAQNSGGAVYNEGVAYLHSAGNTMYLTANTAVNGGAVYNKNAADLSVQEGIDGKIILSENTAEKKGGAVYNAGTLNLSNVSLQTGAQLLVSNNTAAFGAGIYNENGAVVSGRYTKNSEVLFDANKATSGKGGAIYNEVNGVINISLEDDAKIVLNTTSDDIYNLGEITITGQMTSTSTIGGTSFMPLSSFNSSTTEVDVNSTLGGTGVYNISKVLLNLGNTGYIDFEPQLNLKNNVIKLASGSYLNLDGSDTLTNNDFYISADSSVNYKAGSEGAVDLANHISNSGLLNLADGLISEVKINTLNSENGIIHIDVDNNRYLADKIIISDKIFGKNNIVFDNAHSLQLGVDDRIYFAKTQASQSLDDYEFVSKINNGLYEIGIGYDKNTTVNDWYFYRTQYLNPEVVAYIDLPRSAIEQSRSLLFNVDRISKGSCDCYQDGCNYKICNFKDLGGKSRLWATPVYRSGSFDKPVETDFKLYGLDFGLDHQFSISSQFGIFGSYRDGNYSNEGKADGQILSRYDSELDITSILGGLYYRQYFGNLFMSGAVYGGQQSADIKADNEVSASVDGINLGAQAEIGYDIRTTKRSVLTPSIKATYDYIKFDDAKDNSGKEISFDTIHDVELEAGIKYEYQFNSERQLPTTGYIKPSVVQTIANGGNVKINDMTFDKTVENETFGRIEVGADAEIVKNFSVGAFGNYTFGSSYKAWGVGGNVRYNW